MRKRFLVLTITGIVSMNLAACSVHVRTGANEAFVPLEKMVEETQSAIAAGEKVMIDRENSFMADYEDDTYFSLTEGDDPVYGILSFSVPRGDFWSTDLINEDLVLADWVMIFYKNGTGQVSALGCDAGYWFKYETTDDGVILSDGNVSSKYSVNAPKPELEMTNSLYEDSFLLGEETAKPPLRGYRNMKNQPGEKKPGEALLIGDKRVGFLGYNVDTLLNEELKLQEDLAGEVLKPGQISEELSYEDESGNTYNITAINPYDEFNLLGDALVCRVRETPQDGRFGVIGYMKNDDEGFIVGEGRYEDILAEFSEPVECEEGKWICYELQETEKPTPMPNYKEGPVGNEILKSNRVLYMRLDFEQGILSCITVEDPSLAECAGKLNETNMYPFEPTYIDSVAE